MVLEAGMKAVFAIVHELQFSKSLMAIHWRH